MASFVKRLFSSALRRARAAEAAGQLEQAAVAYAEAGEPAHVVRLHRVRANQMRDPWARIEILRLAQSLSDPARDPLTHREVSLELARALVDWVEASNVLDRRDKALLEEAARLFTDGEEHEAAGDTWARMGHRARAAEAYTRAGCIEKLEEALEHEETHRDARQRSTTLVDDFRLAESHGFFLDARKALAAALAAEPNSVALRELHTRFSRRLPAQGCVRLVATDGSGTVVLTAGSAPLTLGRDESASVALLAPGVSRLHAQLVRGQGDVILVEDLGSRHGTFVDGLACAPVQPLAAPQGELRLGERCELRYVRHAGAVELVPQVAAARNTAWVWGERWQGHAAAAAPAELGFELTEGFWHVVPCEGLRVDGEPFRHPVLLRLEARLELPSGRVLEVRH